MNIDLVVFGVYLALIVTVGWVASRRKKKSTDDYFLAGRSLSWWVIGGSLIAANISTHHFIGMSGQGFTLGLAVASYEWMAAIALILYGTFFLPYYLKTRITTMPEFLENRFDHRVRLAFAFISLVGYIFIELAVVLYTGSLAMQSIFGLPLAWGLTILCVIAGGYTIYGGLNSIAYTDVVQVTLLLLGGFTVTILGLLKVGAVTPGYSASIWGGFSALMAGSPEKFHMILPANHPELPWTGVFVGGMWLGNIFYWGCNQFITQRTLAARDVWHGRMGVVFAGYLKLLVPVLVVLPGIIAYRLYDASNGILRSEYALAKGDLAFPTLVKQLLPVGLTGLVMAALLGAVMSHIASLLVSSSSIFTLDVYQRYWRKDAGDRELIRIGRWTSLAVLVIATVAGFFLRDLKGIFNFIQRYWSIAYPAICAVFLGGFFYRRANAKGSLAALICGPVWALSFTAAENAGLVTPIAFLVRAAFDFLFCCALIWFFRTKGDTLPANSVVDRSFTPGVVALLDRLPWYRSFAFWSGLLLLCLAALYVVFR